MTIRDTMEKYALTAYAWLKNRPVRILYAYACVMILLTAVLAHDWKKIYMRNELDKILVLYGNHVDDGYMRAPDEYQRIECSWYSTQEKRIEKKEFPRTRNILGWYRYAEEQTDRFPEDSEIFILTPEDYINLQFWNTSSETAFRMTETRRLLLRMISRSKNTVYLYDVKDSEQGEWIIASESHPYAKALSILFTWNLFALVCLAVYRGFRSSAKYLAVRKKEVASMRRDSMNAIAHEIRTPLSAILGYAESMRLQVCPEKNSYYLEKIEEKGHEINEMINMILGIGRLEDKEIRLVKQRLSMAEEIGKVTELYPETEFITDTGQDMIIEADPEYIGRMLRCIIDNAVRYRTEGTPVRIRIKDGCLKIHNTAENPDLTVLKDALSFQERKDGRYSFGLYYADKACRKNGLHMNISTEDDGVTVMIV